MPLEVEKALVYAESTLKSWPLFVKVNMMKCPVFLGFAPVRNGIFCASFMSACKQMGLMWNRFFLFIRNNLVFQVRSPQKPQYSGPGGPHLSALDKLIYFSNSITTHCRGKDTCTPTHTVRLRGTQVCSTWLPMCVSWAGASRGEAAETRELDRWIKKKCSCFQSSGRRSGEATSKKESCLDANLPKAGEFKTGL